MALHKNTIFTDGSSRGNPGPGGWGAIVLHSQNDAEGENQNTKNGRVTELGGGEKHTTNNRMELTAVIEALAYIAKHNSDAETVVNTDSSYVLNGSTKWLSGWKSNGWKTKAKGEVVNIDLWEKMDEVLGEVGKVSWNLIKGHSGVPANERCDVIATSFADGEKVELFVGKLADYGVDLSVSAPKAKSSHLKPKSSRTVAYSYVSSVEGSVMVHSSWAECEARVKGKSKALFKKSLSAVDEASIISLWKKPFHS